LSCNLGTLTSWNPLDHSRPVTGLLYLYLYPSLKRGQIWVENFESSCLPPLSSTEVRDENLRHFFMRTNGVRLTLSATLYISHTVHSDGF
jgi:hypothetical protein